MPTTKPAKLAFWDASWDLRAHECPCDVEFVDSAGLSVLLRARAMLGREDRQLAVVCPPGPVRRLFEVAGIADLLILFGSREDAAAALVPAE